MISFVCCQCGFSKNVTDDFAGRKVRCPKCKAANIVDFVTATPPSAPDLEIDIGTEASGSDESVPSQNSDSKKTSSVFSILSDVLNRDPTDWNGRRKQRQEQKHEDEQNRIISEARATGAVFAMIGVQDRLEVFEDRLTITPKGVMGFLNKGLKGKKTIPFASIRATQFKEAGAVFSGFLQFSILGGVESTGGILGAARDENTFMFAHVRNNALAAEIMAFIESKTREPHSQRAAPQSGNLADQIQALGKLRDQGILSEDEFQKAKAKLIG